MSNEHGRLQPAEHLPEAKVVKARPAWLLWLIPLGAAALCIWFVYRDFVAAGPALTVYFSDADGLEPGNTQVRYRGAQVGVVKKVSLNADGKYVKVKLRLVGTAKNLARAGSVFWIVRPEVKLGAISGLRTIISGEYITAQPGNGPQTNTFMGAEKAPVAQSSNALHLVLLAPNLSSLQDQSPIFYRGVQVGEVVGYQLGKDAQEVLLQAVIHHEYAPLVRWNSKFWNAGGINFKLSLFSGAELSADSPKTLLTGGIELATPPDYDAPATNGTTFRLYDRPTDVWKTWAPAIALQLPAEAPPGSKVSETPGPMLK